MTARRACFSGLPIHCGDGSIGSTISHSASVRSDGYRRTRSIPAYRPSYIHRPDPLCDTPDRPTNQTRSKAPLEHESQVHRPVTNTLNDLIERCDRLAMRAESSILKPLSGRLAVARFTVEVEPNDRCLRPIGYGPARRGGRRLAKLPRFKTLSREPPVRVLRSETRAMANVINGKTWKAS